MDKLMRIFGFVRLSEVKKAHTQGVHLGIKFALKYQREEKIKQFIGRIYNIEFEKE